LLGLDDSSLALLDRFIGSSIEELEIIDLSFKPTGFGQNSVKRFSESAFENFLKKY